MPKDIASLIKSSSIDSSTLSGTYQIINTGGLPFPCYEVRISNASDVPVLISIDGTNQYEVVPADNILYLHAQNNSGPANQKAYWPAGLTFSAAGTAGTGLIYVTGSYNPE